MFRRVIRRFTTWMLSAAMVISLLPAPVFAAADSSITGSLAVDGILLQAAGDTENSKWIANVDAIHGEVTGTAETSSGCTTTPAASKTGKLTITNGKSGAAELSFAYAYTPNAYSGTAKIIDESGEHTLSGSGSYTFVLDSNASITIEIGSGNPGKYTTSIDLSDIALVMDTTPEVHFQKVSGGNYKVDNEEITVNATKSKSSKEEYVLSVSEDSASTFYGWYKNDGILLSRDPVYHVKFDEETVVYPHFRAAGEPVLGVGARTFFDWQEAIDCANLGTDKIVFLRDDCVMDGNYTLPSGVTLLVPFDEAATCFTTEPGCTQDNTKENPSVYRTLTLSKDASITVSDGAAISVSAVHAGRSDSYVAAVSGKYGKIVMNDNSAITVRNGGSLYAYGYITGADTSAVTAENGAVVYELAQIPGWRGGTAAMNMNGNKEKIFPFSQLYVQNIEAPFKMYSGVVEYIYTSVYTSKFSVGAHSTAIKYVGQDGYFAINSGYVERRYHPKTDRISYDVYGDLKLASMKLSLDVGVKVDLDSANYVYPINSNTGISVKDGGKIEFANDFSLLPGVELTIDENATAVINENADVFVYDSDEWVGKGFAGGTSDLLPVRYSPTKSYTRKSTDLKDVKVDVNGALFVNGDLLTTENGADITSSKSTGTIQYGKVPDSSRQLYEQNTNTVSNGSYKNVPVTPAQLHNADDSYTQTADAAADNVYKYKDGKWYKATKHTITWKNGEDVLSEKQDIELGTEIAYDGETPVKAADEANTYTFVGWEDSRGNRISADEAVTVQSDETYTAVFESALREYTVTWKNGDSETTETLPYGSEIAYKGEAPTKESDAQNTYTFKEWQTADGTALTEGATIKGDVTYLAVYNEEVNEYTVTWLDADGREIKAERKPYGTKLSDIKPEDPTREADPEYTYTFKEWQYGDGTALAEDEIVTGNIVYKAVYDSAVNKYTIEWKDEDGNVLKTDSVEYGSTLTYSGETPVKAADQANHYTFKEWQDAEGAALTEGAAVTGNAVYTAVYEAVAHTEETIPGKAVTCTEDGLTDGVKCSVCGTIIREQETIKASGHSYGDWVITKEATRYEEGEQVRTCEKCGHRDVQTIPKLVVHEYTIRWLNDNGEELPGSPIVVEEGLRPVYDGAAPTKAPSAEAVYTFAGWTPEIVVASVDTDYRAVYKEHRMTDIADRYEVIREATCTEPGEQIHIVYCKECGEELSRANEVIPAQHYLTKMIVGDDDCINAGGAEYEEYWKCSVCGNCYADEGAETEIEVTSHIVMIDEAVAPTCTETGLSEGSHCSVCGKILVPQTEIGATGHDYTEDWIWEGSEAAKAVFGCRRCEETWEIEASVREVRQDSTCTENGDIEYIATATFNDKEYTNSKHQTILADGHRYGEPEWNWAEDHESAEAIFTCLNCGEVERLNADIEKTVVLEKTCTTDGTLRYTATVELGEMKKTDYYDETIPAGHEFGSESITKEPTCTEPGEKETVCEVCGYTVHETIAALGHTLAEIPGVEPTADSEGLTAGVKCEVCDIILVEQHPIPRLHEHHCAEPNWVWNGYETAAAIFTCDVEHCTATEEVQATLTSQKAVEESCSQEGVIEHTATAVWNNVSYQNKKSETIAKLAHTVVVDPAVPATSTKPGKTEGSHCEVCGAIIVAQQEIPATGGSTGGGSIGGGGGGGSIGGGGGGSLEPTNPVPPVTTIEDEDTALAGQPFMFEDVKENDWFYNQVKYVYEKDIMKGTSRTRFSPYTVLNRAMIVTLLYNLEGEPEVKTASKFSDVRSSEWYAKAIAWGEANGIVKGYNETTFGPEDAVTREQLATILHHYAEYKKYDVSEAGELGGFADGATASEYARTPLAWSVGMKIINGTATGLLMPTGSATRAEAATMMNNFCTKYAEKAAAAQK